jgi:predicted O-methyltransferase YrrM
VRKTLRRQAKAALSRVPAALALVRKIRGPIVQRIPVDYRVDPQPRYGHGKPPHALLAQIIGRDHQRYSDTLRSFLRFQQQLLSIPVRSVGEESSDPCWINTWFEGLDIVALYSLVSLRRPAHYIEVGSGQSTRIVRKAIADHGLPTRIISLDPQPRAAIDAICDEVVRSRLEDCDLALFSRLKAGDMLFLDGSHRCFQNSDVVVFFLEVLPQLTPGVLVHVHDIWLPYDYPPEWSARYFSEQYLLGVYLLARAAEKLRIVLPNAFVSEDEELRHVLDELWQRPELAAVVPHGVSFWFET